MATQVLSGTSDLSYTNTTGQNIKLVIYYINTTGSDIKWGGSHKTELTNIRGHYGIQLGYFAGGGQATGSYSYKSYNIEDSTIIDPEPLPLEIALSNGDTFSLGINASGYTQAFNILIVPETG
tara:strand:- start:630 stop:998 length:369 start_codon:yes stop_codon:yes gene_type:complete